MLRRPLFILCFIGAAMPWASAASNQAELHDRVQHLANCFGICDVAVAVVGSVFEAASLGKSVFAYAVLKLVQEGRMALDASILSYLPKGYAHRHFAHRPDSPVDLVSGPALSAVTVRMALNHTSGLPNWSGGPLDLATKPGDKGG